jgi:hypothetical protein
MHVLRVICGVLFLMISSFENSFSGVAYAQNSDVTGEGDACVIALENVLTFYYAVSLEAGQVRFPVGIVGDSEVQLIARGIAPFQDWYAVGRDSLSPLSEGHSIPTLSYAWAFLPDLHDVCPDLQSIIPLVEPAGSVRLDALHGYGDAGMLSVYPGDATIVWEEPPLNAVVYLLGWHFSDKERIYVGVDVDPTDGVSAAWTVPPDRSGYAFAEAYYVGGIVIKDGDTFFGDPYSTYTTLSLPPEGLCLIPMSGPPGDLFERVLPDGTGVDLIGRVSAHYMPLVAQGTGDFASWYKIAPAPEMFFPDPMPEPVNGWVRLRTDMRTFGNCEDLPEIDPTQ